VLKWLRVSFDIVSQDAVYKWKWLGSSWGVGKVIVDGRPSAKAGSSVKAASTIEIIAEVPKYVCR
jgi:predicted rRNA methylase YqxC with S4 and FtsJ domains